MFSGIGPEVGKYSFEIENITCTSKVSRGNFVVNLVTPRLDE